MGAPPAPHQEIEDDSTQSEWGRPPVRRRSRHALAVVSARCARHDRHEIWLRHGALRRLYRSSRRRGRPELLHINEGCGRQERHDHRRIGRAWRSSGAASLEEQQRPAVRLLPEWADHAGCRVAERETEADGSRYRRDYAGQHLPLRHVSANPSGHQAGRGGESMNTINIVSRRGFLERFVSAGALVIGVPVLQQAMGAAKGGDAPFHPSVYLGLEPDGTVVIIAHRSEMGTGIRSVLPMIAADELDADWKRCKVEQARSERRVGKKG